MTYKKPLNIDILELIQKVLRTNFVFKNVYIWLRYTNKRPPDLRNECCQLRLGLVRCRSQKRQDMGNTAGIRRCWTVIGVFGSL